MRGLKIEDNMRDVVLQVVKGLDEHILRTAEMASLLPGSFREDDSDQLLADLLAELEERGAVGLFPMYAMVSPKSFTLLVGTSAELDKIVEEKKACRHDPEDLEFAKLLISLRLKVAVVVIGATPQRGGESFSH